jgi:hypothetical protein
MMVAVPTDADPRQRAWRQMLEHVGLDHNMPMPMQRSGPGVGIGPTKSPRAVNSAPRPNPPASHMRSERPAPRSAARALYPNLK